MPGFQNGELFMIEQNSSLLFSVTHRKLWLSLETYLPFPEELISLSGG